MNRLYTIILIVSILFGGRLSANAQDTELIKSIERYYRYHSDDSRPKKSLAISLAGRWKFQIGNNENWAKERADDSDWLTITAPDDWENQGFNGYDGYAWYRITFDGRRLDRDELHYINLGFIDDVDQTYVNGQLVGKSGNFPPRFRTAWNSKREYFISNEIINFNGQNTVAVQVYDKYQNGGITRGDIGIYAEGSKNQTTQTLAGVWKFSKSATSSAYEPDYNDEKWDDIIVPSYWDNQGYRTLDGIAWYRKSFRVDFEYNLNQAYYMVIGQIDDFDITYLNGVKIGETNDRRRYGDSQSYVTPRVYKIPRGLLETGGENTVAIRVTDIGNEGGIYNGPIAIMTEKQIRSLGY